MLLYRKAKVCLWPLRGFVPQTWILWCGDVVVLFDDVWYFVLLTTRSARRLVIADWTGRWSEDDSFSSIRFYKAGDGPLWLYRRWCAKKKLCKALLESGCLWSLRGFVPWTRWQLVALLSGLSSAERLWVGLRLFTLGHHFGWWAQYRVRRPYV